ncbi:predicted protein [Naegleria gruberi]|uniref:Predicted protein n=1 Tax=Naegleria gruberi TaxID=5762 RepID=D2VKB2_NAEGR|nr:uncharacterized protein NAEGRDRAFT_69332 [Naegleria gruberi]EFC42568.1 predicted protein [Naegleria gruberi]|eukprot:XP_002675312.1 predicted protein [Naegleria gruberi strain NEG-M]
MEEEREATLDSEPTTRVVVILIDHIKNTDDQTTTASRCELLMTSKFSETRLDFLYKETLIYLAKRFDRKDFISLYHNDRKFVLALLKSDCIDADILPQLLEYFASLMKLTSEDEEIIALLMIKNHLSQNQVNGMAHLLEHNTRFLHQVASYGFFLDKLTDRDFVIDLVMEKPKRYKSLSSDLKNDREVAKAAFSKRGSLITNEFYNDRELLLIALTNDGSVYYNLDEELKNDLEIINIAVKTCPELLSELDCSFFNDVEFSERAVKLLPNVLKFVPQILEDLELVKRVFSAEVLPYLKSIHLQDDEIRSQVENLVKECKENYTRASSDLRMDKKLALLALENGVKLSYILIQDYDCYKLAITKNPQTIFFCDPEFLKSHFDLVDLAFSLHGPMLYYDLPSNIKHDPICVMKIIEKEPSVFSSLEKELKQDEQVLSLYYSLLDTSKETVKLVEGKKLYMNTSFQTKPFYDFTPSDFSNIKPFSLDTSNSAFKFGLSNTSNTATTSTSTTTTNNGELVNPFANKNPFSLTSFTIVHQLIP